MAKPTLNFRKDEAPKTPEEFAMWEAVAKGIEQNTHPVVGVLTVPRQIFPNQPDGFLKFSRPHNNGLCKVKGDEIEFLALVSEPQWRGHFRRFQRELKEHYSFIRMWAVDAAPEPVIFRVILHKYGFRFGHDVDQFAELHEVWDWNRET